MEYKALNTQNLIKEIMFEIDNENIYIGGFEWRDDVVRVMSPTRMIRDFKYSDGFTFDAFWDIADSVYCKTVITTNNALNRYEYANIINDIQHADATYILSEIVKTLSKRFNKVDTVVQSLMDNPDALYTFIRYFGIRFFVGRTLCEGMYQLTEVYSNYLTIKEVVPYLASAFIPESLGYLKTSLEDEKLCDLAYNVFIEVPKDVKTTANCIETTTKFITNLCDIVEYVQDKYKIESSSKLSRIVANVTEDLYRILKTIYCTGYCNNCDD